MSEAARIIYKRVKRTVQFCSKCDTAMLGNGSMMFPYNCECGKWEYDEEAHQHILIKKEKS